MHGGGAAMAGALERGFRRSAEGAYAIGEGKPGGMISSRLLMAGRAALGSSRRGYSALPNSAMAMAGIAVPIESTMATDSLRETTQPNRAARGQLPRVMSGIAGRCCGARVSRPLVTSYPATL